MKLQILALAAVVAFSACAETENEDAAPADSVAAANTDSAANEMPTEPQVTGLDEVGDSGIEGEATATHSANDATVSILLKDGAKADATYTAHIHTGTCKDGGPVAVDLGSIQNLQGSKTIPISSLPTDKPLFIQVHDPSGKPVACGNMKGHEADDVNRDTTHATTTSH